jgi:cell division protein FtsN
MYQPELALIRFNEIINLFPGSGWADWAQLGRGDYFIAQEDYKQAIAAYNEALEVQPESETIPFALSGLVRCFNQLKDKERALLYYNLLKERYPYSVESITDPAEELNLNNKSKNQIEAERLAGVRYTIQLGVFGIKENALKLRSKFENEGFSVTIKRKIIAGKEYHVVRVGKFTSYEEALKLKKKLETQTGESYRIVMM